MSNKIVLKRTNVPGKVPVPTDLVEGELALNLVDSRLFSKNGANQIIELGGSVKVSGVTGLSSLVAGPGIDFTYYSASQQLEISTRGLTWADADDTAPAGGVSIESPTVYTPRVVTLSDANTITLNADTTDLAVQLNTQSAGTLTMGAPSGTPTDGQRLMLRINTVAVQTFAWNAVFTGSTDLPLPTVTSGASKTDYLTFIYNATATKWQLWHKNFGF